jgi:hypothetical protein
MSAPSRVPDPIVKLAGMFCGCCTVETTWGAVLQELERLDQMQFAENDGLAAAIVDHLGLSDHGVSIRGGWLTSAGQEALAFLRENGVDWQSRGEWIDSEGVTWGTF